MSEPRTSPALADVSAAIRGLATALQPAAARANEAMRQISESMKPYAEAEHRAQAVRQRELSEAAVDALGEWLFNRDWPSALPRERHGQKMYAYKCQAAAILNGEAWAVEKAWPLVGHEIASRSRQ